MTTYNKLYENWMKHIQEEEQLNEEDGLEKFIKQQKMKIAGQTFVPSEEGDFKMGIPGGGKSKIISQDGMPNWVWGSGKTHSYPEGFYGSVVCYGGTVALGQGAKIIPYKDGKLVEQDLTDTSFWPEGTQHLSLAMRPFVIMAPRQIWFADGSGRLPSQGKLISSANEHFFGNNNDRGDSKKLVEWIKAEAEKHPEFWKGESGQFIRKAVSATIQSIKNN